MAVHSLPTFRFAPSGAMRSAIGYGWAVLVAMIRARGTRRMLGEMDDRMLADIGIGRGEAHHEAARPMWDLTPPRR